MAYRRKRTYKPRTKYGKVFRTKKGKWGQYKYVGGKKVGFRKTRRPRKWSR